MKDQNIPNISSVEIAAFKAKKNLIVEQTYKKVLSIFDFENLLGKNYEELVRNGIINSAKTFETVMTVSFPELMDQQLTWGKEYFPNIGIPSEIVLKELEILAEETEKLLPGAKYPGLSSWMQMMIKMQRKAVEET